MDAQIERRTNGLSRLPVDLLVELSHEGDEDVYEADAIDLGRGGIGLRASVLPEVGQRLRCRFEVPGRDALCEAQGEVVWAEDAGRWSGAFGVRFEEMDARTAQALDAIAPAPIEDPGTPEEMRAPRSVKLRLDGVGSAIEGELVGEGGSITIEQAMPFLQIGRGAEIEQGAMKVRAVLERVRLRVENGTPRLVLELTPQLPEAELAELEPARDADATLQDEDLESLVARGREPIVDEPEEAYEAPIARPAGRPLAHTPTTIVRREREAPRVVSRRESIAIDEDEEREEPLLSQKARAAVDAMRPQLARAMSATRAFATLAIARSGPWLVRVRDAIVAAWRLLAGRVALHAPKLGAVLGKAPRRRTTMAPAAAPAAPLRRARGAPPVVAPPPDKSRARGLAIGAIALVAVGLAVYGLASRPEAPAEIEIRPATDTVSDAPVTPTLAAPVTVPETFEPIAPPAPMGAVAPTPGWDRAMPEPASAAGPIAAPSYPSMADRRGEPTAMAAAPAEAPIVEELPAPSGGMEFGAAEVERGRTTTLRMSTPVQSIEGQADGGGFTITIRGALSLDRAAPLAAASSSIERASIINRGDHCVLTIRFVTGRTPAYRVAAHGTSLDVTIGR